MSFSARLLVAALAFFGAVQAAPTRIPIAKSTGPVVEKGYIITLKPSAERLSHRSVLSAFADDDATVNYEWPEINAFAGTFSDEALIALQESADVESIEPDVWGGILALTTQTNAPWGLQRVSQTARLSRTSASALDYTYTYDDSAGAGVDVYVIDTGINVNHQDFSGRARWGSVFGGYSQSDEHGHGTHCAGTIAGTRFGVAKKANVIAVRTINSAGGGAVSDTIAGVNWVTQQAASSGRPSVISISLGFPATTALDNAVTAAINAGVHVAVAAGNNNGNASSLSPARATAVTTVGASDITDTRASFSNYGAVVDIFAPGVGTVSASHSSNTGTATMSGTSMATPHIAGIFAYLIGLGGNASPATLLARLKATSPDGILTSIPSGTINELAVIRAA